MRDPVTAEWTIKDSFLPPSPQNGSSFGYSVGAGPFGFAIGAFAQGIILILDNRANLNKSNPFLR